MVSSEHNPVLTRAQVEADLADLAFREPVIDDYDPALDDIGTGEDFLDTLARADEHSAAIKAGEADVDRRWLMLTEAGRRAVISSPEARRQVKAFTQEPLSEQLPQKAVRELAATDPRTTRIVKHVGKVLEPVLALDPIADQLLTPDIRNAASLQRKQDTIDSLARMKARQPEDYDEFLQEIRKRVQQSPGITEAERRLVARRYRYARDVKLLGLIAELQDEPLGTPEVQDGLVSYKLASGTKLVMTDEAFQATPSLLDPRLWERRQQLKDRVYQVDIAGEHFIMKERKTARHTDVKEHGHRDGLTSRQEFETAQGFSNLGTIEIDNVRLRWEKPLGYVEFPDGFQFCLFERETDLTMTDPRQELARVIMASPEAYAALFIHTRQLAKQMYDKRPDLLRGFEDQRQLARPKRFAISPAARRHKRAYEHQPQPDELTFEEFAQVVANDMTQEARELFRQTIRDHGYKNNDLDGYAFHVQQGVYATLELVGFDFEYYAKDAGAAARLTRNNEQAGENGDAARMRALRVAGARAIAIAASYALLEQAGLKLPPKIKF